MAEQLDDWVAERIVETIESHVRRHCIFSCDPDAKHQIMGLLGRAPETTALQILKGVVPGWLMGEMYDLSLLERRISEIMGMWRNQKAALAAAALALALAVADDETEIQHFSDDSH
jgi:hypothetical protein